MSAPHAQQNNNIGWVPPLPPSQKKKSHRGAVIAVIAAVLTLLIGVGIGGSSKDTAAPAAAAVAAPAVTVTETAAAGAPVTVVKTVTPKPVVKTVEKRVTITATVTATKTEGPPPPPPAEFIVGVNIVGVDVQPGTYQSKQGDCYFERLSGTSGTFDDIIANGIGATVVTIESSDAAFKSQRCAPWTKVG